MQKLLYPLVIIIVITSVFDYFGFRANILNQAFFAIAIIIVLTGFFSLKIKKIKLEPAFENIKKTHSRTNLHEQAKRLLFIGTKFN